MNSEHTTVPRAAAPAAGALALQWPWVLLIVTLATLALRVVDLGFSFDGDEVFSVDLARDSWAEVIARSLADRPHPPLYNILLYAWLTVWGDSESSARTLSLLLFSGAAAIIVQMLRPLVRPLVGLSAGLVIAFSGFLIFYGQQARPYALIAFVGALNLLTFRRLLAAPSEPWRAVAWAATGALLGYTQYIGAIYLAVEGCLLLIWLPRQLWLRALGPAIVASAAVLPWMWTAFRGSPGLDTVEWIGRPDVRALARFFVGAIGWPPFPSGFVLLAILAVLLVAGSWRVWKSGGDSRDALLFGTIAFAPVLACFALSQWLELSIWAPRQLMLSVLALVGLLAILVDRLPGSVRLASCIVLVVWAAAGASDGFSSRARPAWRRIATRIEAADANATIVTQERWAARPLSFYVRTASIAAQAPTPATAGTGPVYFVCRPPLCEELAALERVFGQRQEVATDLYGASGGRLDHSVVTYRLRSSSAGNASTAGQSPRQR